MYSNFAEAITNSMIFLIAFSASLLLVYRKAAGFSMLMFVSYYFAKCVYQI
jgi:hypothetical protein